MKLADISGKKKEYMRAKIDEIETNSKIKSIRYLNRGTGFFQKGYQPRNNIAKDKKGDLVVDSHSISVWWRNDFSRLLIIHRFNDIRQTEIRTAEPIIPEPSAFEVEMAIVKLKCHKSPGIDQIPLKLIKAGGRIIRCWIRNLINYIRNEEELCEGWK